MSLLFSLFLGDFFKDPLPKADMYILANVLHGMPEEKCTKLLTRVYDNLEKGKNFDSVTIYLAPSLAQFQYQDLFFRYRDCLYNDKRVARPSYRHNRNLILTTHKPTPTHPFRFVQFKIYPWEKKWPPWLLTVSPRWVHRELTVTKMVTASRDLGRDWAVT